MRYPLAAKGKYFCLIEETGLPYVHLSRICAMSVGENYAAEELMRRGSGEE